MKPPAEFERAILLAVLRLGDDAYGVAVRDELEKRLERSVSFGAVYTTLDRLVAKGMLTTFAGDPTPQRGGRAKKFFRLEPDGIEALEIAKKTSRAIWAIRPLRGSK